MTNPAISRDDLVAGLHARGVCYLAPTPVGDELPVSDDVLSAGLAASPDARLRFSLAALFLRHPGLAEAVERVHVAGLPAAALRELEKHYAAAVYLQRLWRTRLRLAFGETPLLPERYLEAQGLPAPDFMHGEFGLRRLTERGLFNDWSSYEQAVDLLIDQPCGP